MSIPKTPSKEPKTAFTKRTSPATPPSDASATPSSTTPSSEVFAIGKISVNPAGYGFVARDDGEDDVFIAMRHRGAAFDGDEVRIAVWPGQKGTEGRVVEVRNHSRTKITGALRRSGRSVYLEADDPRILGHVNLEPPAEGKKLTLKEGLAVVAEILRYPTTIDAPITARVTHVLGDPDDPRTEVEKVIVTADLPDAFPDDVAAAAVKVPGTVRPQDLIDRADLRDREFLTIDPETARDFDDAVCIEDGPRPGWSRLFVAVADVSHYVQPGTAIDKEARQRSVSVYLPNRAIPMLPEQLSSQICSLNPEVDRLAMVTRLDIDEEGRVVSTQLVAAVIRSRARLDYAGVAAALGGDLRGSRARYEPYLPSLVRMQELSQRLRLLRLAQGAMDFDLPEAVVVLDEDDPRRVRDVKRSRAKPEVRAAYRLVEEFMLAANVAVARYFVDHELDALWRVHHPPTAERLKEFATLVRSFGLHIDERKMRTPRELRDFLARLAGTKLERALSFLLLRSLKQAIYDVENSGHFGLAAPAYLHFTSPIRRYPDLVVHRLLKRQLRKEGLPAGGAVAGSPPTKQELIDEASRCSTHERRAMEAEREVVDMYRAFLMRDRVGDELAGTVSGVTSFGLFIEITEPFVEGLVKTERLGRDRFIFDDRQLRLVGERSGRAFTLGDAVRVRIESVSVPRRRIELALVEADSDGESPSEPPKSRTERPKTRQLERKSRSRGGR